MEKPKCFLPVLLGFLVLYGQESGNPQTISWEQTNGPLGGSVQALVVHPNGQIFAGTANSGVFRSTNNGERWAQTSLTGVPIYSFAINAQG
jgi:hypothetical protein